MSLDSKKRTGPIRVGVFGATVFGLAIGVTFGLASYFWHFPFPPDPVLDWVLGAVFAVGCGLSAYFRGIFIPRRWK